jgi:hypothetical protein
MRVAILTHHRARGIARALAQLQRLAPEHVCALLRPPPHRRQGLYVTQACAVTKRPAIMEARS